MQALVSVVCCFCPTTTHCVFKRYNCPKSVVCDLCHPPIRRSVCATRLWWWRWWTGRRVKMTTWSVWPTSISLTWSMRALETPTGYTTSMPTGWGTVTVNGCWFFFLLLFPPFLSPVMWWRAVTLSLTYLAALFTSLIAALLWRINTLSFTESRWRREGIEVRNEPLGRWTAVLINSITLLQLSTIHGYI